MNYQDFFTDLRGSCLPTSQKPLDTYNWMDFRPLAAKIAEELADFSATIPDREDQEWDRLTIYYHSGVAEVEYPNPRLNYDIDYEPSLPGVEAYFSLAILDATGWVILYPVYEPTNLLMYDYINNLMYNWEGYR